MVDTMAGEYPIGAVAPAPAPVRGGRPTVSAILPLSALQGALWVHCRRVGQEERDPGRVQVRAELHGPLDPELLGRAWQLTVDGIEALRTSINVDARGEPLLVVRAAVSAPVAIDDWRSLDADETERRLRDSVAAERLEPLALARAPSVRLRCLRLDEARSVLLCSCHHLLLDGWSSTLVLRALLGNYLFAAGRAAAPSAEPLPYSAYRRALGRRDGRRSAAFWRERLRGHERAARLGGPGTGGSDRATCETLLLDAVAAETLRRACRRAAITPATLVQGAWSLVLGTLCAREDVVIALTTAGRPPELAGIESTAGFLSNVVPLRVALDADARATSAADWLRAAQARQFAAREHEHVPYADILAEAEPAFARDGVDSLLVIENLPSLDADAAHPLAVRDYRSDIVSGFPLTLTVLPLEEWTLRLDFDPSGFDERWIEQLGDALRAALSALAEADGATLGEVQRMLRPTLPERPDAHREGGRRAGTGPRHDAFCTPVPPDNLAELSMLGLWEDILQKKPLGMDADFFDSGGGSLAALRLIAAVERQFGRRVPVQRFLEAPTPRAMTRMVEIEGAEGQPIPSLVTLRPPPAAGAVEPALFCLHAGGGHALFYRDFARRLGGRRAVYALQPKGIDGLDAPLATIEEMAAHYVAEIVAVQPEGPYHLLCYCFGGGLILEMARRLHAEGREIGHLVVIDALSPIPAAHPMARFGWRAYLVHELVRQRQWKTLLHGLREALRAARRRARGGRDAEVAAEGALSRARRVQDACRRAFESYRAEPCAFELHILRSGGLLEPHRNQDVYMRAWDSLAPRRLERRLDDAHGELFLEPCVRRTGASVDAVLDRPSPNGGSGRRTNLDGVRADD